MSQMPTQVYYVIGFMVLANIGTIISVLVMGFRAVWYMAKLDSRVEKTERDTDAAHEKIRFMRNLILKEGNNGTTDR